MVSDKGAEEEEFMKKTAAIVIRSVTALILCVCAAAGYFYISLPDSICTADNTELCVARGAVTVEGGDEAEYCLFGAIPIKKVAVEEVDRPMLVPCGTPFGIKLLTDGAVVVSLGDVSTANGMVNPARDGGIKEGDVIKEVNGVKIASNHDITDAVQLNPKKTEIKLERSGRNLSATVKPVQCASGGIYKIGVWVRDSSAGIGTVTFFERESGIFGGLGHAVCDVDTGQPLPVSSGEVASVTITSVRKGYSGEPGELCGSFISRMSVGEIYANTSSGLFGRMDYNPSSADAIPMAMKQEVEVGPAKIRTTLRGTTAEEYDVVIESIDYSNRSCKNMVVKITDKRLLDATGGIVQGMSGSPIIQNGRLIGAVTHVFVNDPTKGYGIFAENMYSCAPKTAEDNAA